MQQSLLINFGEIFGNLYESMGFVQGDWQRVRGKENGQLIQRT